MKPKIRTLKEVETPEEKFIKVKPDPYKHIIKAYGELQGLLLSFSEVMNEVQLAVNAFEKINKEKKENERT